MSETMRCGVIMAGGAGERFWPLSRKNRPKQLLPLTDPEKSMLACAVELLAPVVPPERTYIVTGRHLVEPIREARLGLPPDNILGEPCKRNTSGALIYATSYLMAKYADVPPESLSIAVTTADHRIGRPDVFAQTVSTALTAAEQKQALGVCGIVPAFAHTGLGYIEVEEDGAVEGLDVSIPVQKVRRFHEKPEREVAEQYVASGRHFWNSGMFFWTADAFVDELEAARSETAETMRAIRVALRRDEPYVADQIFAQLEDISIDYALMEHARNVLMVPGTFPWADVGSWPALCVEEHVDAQGNVCVGDPIVQDASNCVVYNDVGG
ncbi:MAG TPA: mannose-1-phosphate guanylyltransferase, partial [Candidatus Hydrogenedentes bacterium]|nr:mannose-1-phosphate guanylyltransferase [Candidatus Hydrogenedentota bacterium]